MKITKEHFYHGAVLNQIAEHKQFTAINALKVNGKTSRSAFKVNDDIAVYLKYASEPTEAYEEYIFTFAKHHLAELRKINDAENSLHLALVCVQDNEVCCFPYSKLVQLITKRKQEFGKPEQQYTLLVTLKKGEAFRVNMNEPGKKKAYLGKPLTVRRNACPNALFR
ncbi:MAG: hypothetical protein OXE44_10345 [Nitrospinae bacterium]|nr:hypothetical protein [Nitrospinota bacterium]